MGSATPQGLVLESGTLGQAIFSPCRGYRYTLTRTLAADGPALCAVLLNPSTADQDANDPTVARVVDFATRWGFGSLTVTNAFALRSTDPKALRRVTDPVGPHNDEAIREALQGCDGALLAWGNHAAQQERSTHLRQLVARAAPPKVWSLGLTKRREPKHPLYLPKTARRRPYNPLAARHARVAAPAAAS